MSATKLFKQAWEVSGGESVSYQEFVEQESKVRPINRLRELLEASPSEPNMVLPTKPHTKADSAQESYWMEILKPRFAGDYWILLLDGRPVLHTKSHWHLFCRLCWYWGSYQFDKNDPLMYDSTVDKLVEQVQLISSNDGDPVPSKKVS